MPRIAVIIGREFVNRPIRWVALPLSLNVMLALLAACGQATQPPQPRPAQSATQSATRTAPSATSSPAVIAPTGNPSPSAPSEADRLAAFFAASAQLDNQLHQAAALVNGDIGATRILIKPATKAAVGQLQTTAVTRAIPAGLPHRLLGPVLAVYNDLESRRLSLMGAARYSPPAVPRSSPEGQAILRCLGNGGPAAARYDGDVSAVRDQAQVMPPVAVAAPDSRAAAELTVWTTFVRLAQSGCGGCGGRAPAPLPPITWHPKKELGAGTGSYTNGTVGGIAFLAEYRLGQGWNVLIYAC